jgi:hypothetical protein
MDGSADPAGGGNAADGLDGGVRACDDYDRRFDVATESEYFLQRSTGDSFWAVANGSPWMEVLDDASQCRYHLHSETGETKWEQENAPPSPTVWEELKDPITGHHYYYSNVCSHDSPSPCIQR